MSGSNDLTCINRLQNRQHGYALLALIISLLAVAVLMHTLLGLQITDQQTLSIYMTKFYLQQQLNAAMDQWIATFDYEK